MLYKQVSQIAAIILDQTAVQKRKYSRPKNISADELVSSDEASELEKGIY